MNFIPLIGKFEMIDAFIAGEITPEAATVFDLPDNKLRIIVGSKP